MLFNLIFFMQIHRQNTTSALAIVLFFIFASFSKINSQNYCSEPPPGCSLNCPDGYVKASADHCICMCQQSVLTCYGLVCKINERCVNINGKIGCVPITSVNEQPQQQSQFAQVSRPVVPSFISAVHLGPREQYVPVIPSSSTTNSAGLIGECPTLVSGNCEVQCRTDRDCPAEAGLRCCPNGCGRECVMTINVVPFRNHLAIKPLKTITNDKAPSHLNEKCESIKCTSPLYECQLVESDCGSPPCPVVPKCLINPCPSGSPMKMPTGVTALCKRETQCWEGFWCHQIGYNGLGFCCPEPRKSSKNGVCEARQTKKKSEEGRCSAECKSDSDCAGADKCCFDGCGLQCRAATSQIDEKSQEKFNGGYLAISRPTKERDKATQSEKKAKPGECPKMAESGRMECATHGDECLNDADCQAHLKCCSDGCQKRCIYIAPTKVSNAHRIPAEEDFDQTKDNLIKMENHEQEKGDEEVLTGSSGKRPGKCPKMVEASRKYCTESERITKEECQNDSDCSAFQKCCLDACGTHICLHPTNTTECLALRGAATILKKISKHNRLFQPKCDASGRFLPIQSKDGFSWCVDQTGQELSGTRTPKEQFEGCERRRICPIVDCPLKCTYGFQMDGLGCPQCICRDSPCHSVQCQEGHLCRLTVRKCLNSVEDASLSTCLIPECVLNTCLRGEPLEDVGTGALFRCDEQTGRKCPPGFYCQKLGIGDSGYCCSGLVLQSELLQSATKCPTMLNIGYRRMEQPVKNFHSIGCRLTKECDQGKMCCFNGYSSECIQLDDVEEAKEEDDSEREEKREEEETTTSIRATTSTDTDAMLVNLNGRDSSAATCPAHLRNASNPGCTSNCLRHSDCAQRSPHMRCCPFGCGQQCQFPERLSPCVHLLATTLREVDKLAKLPETLGRPTVQCTAEGHFEPIQFDALTGQYWCVDPLTGEEQQGTRISSSPIGSALPDCSIRHQCKFNCPKELLTRCEHGVKLDHKGCPVDERCECQNPCDNFKCSLPETEICVLKRVECTDGGGPCPSIPTCIKNICREILLEMAIGAKACTSSAECNEGNGECRFIANQLDERIGLCCDSQKRQLEQPLVDSQTPLNTLHRQRQGICPSAAGHGRPRMEEMMRECSDECQKDSQCAGIQKCCLMADQGCRRCVQPLLATNCQNMLAALEALESAHIHHFIPRPNCDSKKGTFLRVQCDSQAYCWCVDPHMGRPILGTRRLQPEGEFCSQSERKACPIFCPQRRLLECPFGVEQDLDGCPLTSECRCRTLCESVRCPDGNVCILQPRDCQEAERSEEGHCLPMPICQPSPCGGSLHPALGPVSKLPLHCDPTEEQPSCPNGFRCNRPLHEANGGQGVCCPLSDEEKKMEAIDENEGASKSNPCILPMDQGRRENCNRGMELRFYYDFSEHNCEEFVFAGCAGNANNFRSRDECQQHCLGSQNEQSQEMEMFTIGFTLDEQFDAEDEAILRNSLFTHLARHFGLDEDQIRDIHFDKTGNVHFNLIGHDARRKAKAISDSLAFDQFQFTHNNHHFRAKPETWFARQIPLTGGEHLLTKDYSGQNKNAIFWVILTASIFFSLIVVLMVCCGYAFLRDRSRSVSAGGSVCFSPSPRVLAAIQHWSPLPNRKEMSQLSPEEVQRMRAAAAGGGAAHLLTPVPSSTSTASTHPVTQQQQSTNIGIGITPRILSKEERKIERREQGGTTFTTMYY